MSASRDEGLLRLARQDLVAMPGYEPVEPLDALARRLGIPEERIVKLDGNENPYGPSPRVREALARFPYYHIYPDPEQRQAREAIADYVGASSAQIVVGSGSDELLDLTGRLFLSPGDDVVNAPPTFGIYEFVARTYGAGVVEVPRREDFALDVEAVERALAAGAKLMFLASPNNPTGNAVPREELERLLSNGVAVVVDEAYAEFAGESFAPLVAERDNLIVMRTFSKWAGLAGLRAGYGVFPPAVAETIRKIGAAFTAGWSRSGGTEATLLQLLHLLFAHGMLVLGLPWSDRMRRSGSYYGATAHGEVTEDDRAQARQLGHRVAELTQRLFP